MIASKDFFNLPKRNNESTWREENHFILFISGTLVFDPLLRLPVLQIVYFAQRKYNKAIPRTIIVS